MSELIGYQLVDQSNNVITSWGGIIGQMPGIPDMIALPNGDQVHCPRVGDTYGEWTLTNWYVPTPPISNLQVDAERDRRRDLPFTVNLPTGKSFPINMDGTSQSNIQGLSTVGLYLSNAAPTQVTVFRDYNNTNWNLMPGELVAMGMLVAAHIQALYIASWTLKGLV